MLDLLSGSSLGGRIQALKEPEWLVIFKEAGFVDGASKVCRIDFLGQVLDYLRADGVRRYFLALGKGLLDPGMRVSFFKRDVLRAW